MFKRILIANRGEIAIRVMRAAKELGIETVAVYHSVDKEAPFVHFADFAYEVYSDTPKSAYLDIQQIIDVARRSNSEAIHPGYGFLSEREAFSQACLDANIKFIGPYPKSIEMMGSKTKAREIMFEAGVPIVPGTKEKINDYDQLHKTASEIGYPILLKAAAGGGGKGMRKVYSSEDLIENFESAKREALKSFVDDSIYIEKLIENPKHIEIQIIADEHGNYLHFGERDCSIQRRHQKLIEECPSTVLDDELRQKMGQVAINAAKACNYVNAGTVEFLFDKNKNFYFLEMNTRIQVEHPVTERVTRADLVKEQIKIAAGEKLKITQQDIKWIGHSIECRINAEDPFNNFLPSTGKITYLREPGGKGVRIDSGIEQGSTISIHFDPMVAKLITLGVNREEALDRMIQALKNYKIFGIKTVIPFLIAVLEHPEFRNGNFDTGFLESKFNFEEFSKIEKEIEQTIAAIAAYSYRKVNQTVRKENQNQKNNLSKWKMRKFI
ncbi:MAG: acetyl-CoA carboxylase biotin carboxylase subunit [Candidatus Kapabacteria bacterium]|nr:acetyl-CoA carboxylase biotin carboxylase subunit [Candidatus Kapabacteria bacterium]